MAEKGFVGIAACWFTGRKGEGTRFITPIDFNDAPPLIDAPGSDGFRLARVTIDSHETNDTLADGGSAVTNIERARKFEDELRNENKKVEVKYNEGGGHNSIFTNQKQFDDTVQHIVTFLQHIVTK